MSNEIERKHREEQEFIIEDALRDSLSHLRDAADRFSDIIQDPRLNDEFAQGVGKARRVLAKLGVS